jgi:hypothetical protein
MRWMAELAVMAALTAVGVNASGAQAAAGQAAVPGAVLGGSAQAAPATPAEARTEKQKELARQTERLFDMATELKVQVDKTNKNILSMKVVEKAQEIEVLARGMKEEARR